MEHLPIANDSVDIVVRSEVYEHFEKGTGKCLSEALRVLRPGGRLFFTVLFQNIRLLLRGTGHPPKTSLKTWHQHETSQFYRYQFYQYRFFRRELALELTTAGFDVRTLHPIGMPIGFRRFLVHDCKLPLRGFRRTHFARIADKALVESVARLLPPSWFGHMLFSVADKPHNMSSTPSLGNSGSPA